MTLAPATASAGDVVALTIDVPRGYVWGMDAYLEAARGARWQRVFLLWTDPHADPNGSVALEGGAMPAGVAVRARGYADDATLRIRLPEDLEEGEYRVVKTFTRHGSAPAQERTVTRSVALEIR